MRKLACIAVLITLGASPSFAQEADEAADKLPDERAAEAKETKPAPQADGAKTLSGMSILGNEETPKSLVIVPWKSSELGDELSLSDSLDDQARPVDKEVFLRELRFYEIRAEH